MSPSKDSFDPILDFGMLFPLIRVIQNLAKEKKAKADALISCVGTDLGYPAFLCLFIYCFHSMFTIVMKRCTSLIGTHEVRLFMAFSKSESRMVSRWQSMIAAHVACSTSIPLEGGAKSETTLVGGRAGLGGSEGEEPSNIKTSHTRSWATNGMERLKRVIYQRVAYAVGWMQSSS